MKLIIAGNREFNDYEDLCKVVDSYPCVISEIVSGGCRGADALGERYAREKGILIKIFPANWAAFGPSAGPRRNAEMAEYADAAILFWDRKSKGTRSMYNEMNARNKLLTIYHKDAIRVELSHAGVTVFGGLE